jgi:quercetin dioxygenase-like cupin family protein
VNQNPARAPLGAKPPRGDTLLSMSYTRRDLSLLLPALAAAAQNANAAGKMVTTKIYSYPDLPVKANGANASRAVFDGETHSGYHVDIHMTELGPGMAPHPPHHHVHEEVLMLKNGQLDITANGKTTRVGPGSVVYVASNEEHGWKNPGPDKAEYFVMALGREA